VLSSLTTPPIALREERKERRKEGKDEYGREGALW
jgi:hypothetical protein